MDGPPCQKPQVGDDGTHLVDCLYASQGIIYRLIQVCRQQTNGPVQRFKQRINGFLRRKARIKENDGQN